MKKVLFTSIKVTGMPYIPRQIIIKYRGSSIIVTTGRSTVAHPSFFLKINDNRDVS